MDDTILESLYCLLIEIPLTSHSNSQRDSPYIEQSLTDHRLGSTGHGYPCYTNPQKGISKEVIPGTVKDIVFFHSKLNS